MNFHLHPFFLFLYQKQYTSLNMMSVYGPRGTHNGLKYSFSLMALFLNTPINKFKDIKNSGQICGLENL